jgi:hypothetical protein
MVNAWMLYQALIPVTMQVKFWFCELTFFMPVGSHPQSLGSFNEGIYVTPAALLPPHRPVPLACLALFPLGGFCVCQRECRLSPRGKDVQRVSFVARTTTSTQV